MFRMKTSMLMMMTRQAIERWVGARPFNWVANWIDWYLKVKLLFCCVEIRIMHFRILATTATTRRGRSIYAICTHLKHQRAEIKKTNPLILLKTQNFPKNFGNYCNYISRAQDNFFQPHWIHHIPAGGTGKYNGIAISSCLQPIVQTNVADCVSKRRRMVGVKGEITMCCCCSLQCKYRGTYSRMNWACCRVPRWQFIWQGDFLLIFQLKLTMKHFLFFRCFCCSCIAFIVAPKKFKHLNI